MQYDPDRIAATFAAELAARDAVRPLMPGGVKERLAHLVGLGRRTGEAAPEPEAGTVPRAAREKTGLAHAVAALSDEVRRLTVELTLADLKAETQAWRRTAVEGELTRAQQALEAERAASAAAAVEDQNWRQRSEVEIGRLTMDLSLARIRADEVAGRLLAAQARIADLEAAARSATSAMRAAEAAHRIDLEAAELRVQALAAELDSTRSRLASVQGRDAEASRDPAPAELPGVFGGGGWRLAPPRRDQAGVSTAPPLSAQSLNPPILKTLP